MTTQGGVRQPKLLDLCCGAGGSAVGYHRAGFDVTGIDSRAQPHYPFRFIQADALTFPLEGYDVLHASPPCEKYTRLNARLGYRHQIDLIGPIRDRLEQSGIPFVIENVLEAPLDRCVTLCGSMFGLRVLRHRRFESSLLLFSPGRCVHQGTVAGGQYVSVTGHGGYIYNSLAVWRTAMGIDWMDRAEMAKAIPPAYTFWIGSQVMRAVTQRPQVAS